MNILKRYISTLLTALLLVGPNTVPAQVPEFNLHPLEDISQTAINLAARLLDSSSYTNISITSQAMDERLRLKQCELPLQASINNSQVKPGRISVSIRCNGVSPWSLYVPVLITASTEVVMVKGPLPRGTVLSASNLALKKVQADQLPANYINNINEVVGKELSRFINNETYATAQMLKIRNLIVKGQEVVILAKNNNLEVRMAGVALEPGQQGDRISVKNSASGRTIEGQITESGMVIIKL